MYHHGHGALSYGSQGRSGSRAAWSAADLAYGWCGVWPAWFTDRSMADLATGVLKCGSLVYGAESERRLQMYVRRGVWPTWLADGAEH